MNTDKYPIKKYPTVGACGLSCGLCPRYHTDGKSRCPGCCGQDFFQKHPSCGFITCCVEKRHLEVCAQCIDWEACERVARNLKAAESFDSFISYKRLAENFAAIQRNGIEAFVRSETEKQALLSYLCINHDDGRSKSFYCISCQLIPLQKLRESLDVRAEEIDFLADIKARAKLIRKIISNLANELQIDLRLRK